MSSDNKVKGLLKGLRFISQIFDNEKEPEIQIGNPTDVRHVAHIGWDGPSENSPSWMHEFKSVPGIPSAHPKIKGDNQCKGSDNSVEWVSTDSKRRGSGGSGNYHQGQEDTAELTKSSRRHSNSTGNMRESHAKEKSDRPRQTKRSSKHHSQSNESLSGSKHTEQQPMSNMDSDSLQLQGSHELPPRSQQDNNNTRRSHSKKTKDACSGGAGAGAGAGGVSSKSRPKAQTKDPNSNEGPHSRSSSKTRNKHRHSEEDGQVERGSSEDVLRNYSN